MTEHIIFEIGGARVFSERSGEGETVVFLHAGVADRRMWRDQMAAFSGRYETVAYDRRGFGKTVTEDEPFSHVQDLRAVLDQLGRSTASLVGCSQGGRIALDFALAYPERVRKLVLIATAISGAPPPETIPAEIEERLIELDEADTAGDLKRLNELEARLWLDGPTSVTGRVKGELRDLFLDMNGIALRLPELTQEIEPVSAYERLAEVQIPVLVIWGALDFPHLRERCQHLVEKIPAAEGAEIPDTAHLPNLEQPEIVNRLLADFLENKSR
ncbi:MAG: alpha/beta hydrolase [Ardenticatenaceae bacterium]|nr:alpha/beta hydrolase [Ardenticatenaceae bacterium]